MKKLIFLFLLSQIVIKSNGQEIKSINDDRIPANVRAKIKSMSSVDELEKFKYSAIKTFADTSLATVKQNISLSFSNGKITGTIQTEITNVGFELKKENYSVEICFIYCCVDENNKEDCTKDFKEYKRKKNDPKCKSTTSRPCD